MAAEEVGGAVAALAPKPVYHQQGMMLTPARRVDGSTEDPPWNVPEPMLWDHLRQAEIHGVDEDFVDILSGNLLVQYAGFSGDTRSGLLSLGGVRGGLIYAVWGEEYSLRPERNDILKRQQAFYESSKAFGMEDMVPPLAVRLVNLSDLLSISRRSRFSKAMGVPASKVAKAFGETAILQVLPTTGRNFLEYWAFLAATTKDRWAAASDKMRHGLYRAMILDILMGTALRSLSSLFHSKASDVPVFYSTEVVLPHPARTADWYLNSRAQGWGRPPSSVGGTAKPGVPASSNDLIRFMDTMGDREKSEWMQTAKQITRAVKEDLSVLLSQVLLDIGAPKENIAGLWGRFLYLHDNADTMMSKPFEYVQSVLVPLRRGFVEQGTAGATVVEGVNGIMTAALGKPFDFAKMMQS